MPSGKHTHSGYPLGIGYLHIDTGRAFAFREEEAPEWLQRRGTYTSFSPTAIKNYPSQGFATGDIVPMCVGELYYALKSSPELRNKALLVNTVHDSVLLDVHDSVLAKAQDAVETCFRSAPALLMKHFGIHFSLPLNVSSSAGKNWAEMKELTPTNQQAKLAA
jgi:DNA polymerase I-like protein with 3'-5' exonuclease and polymerase domains